MGERVEETAQSASEQRFQAFMDNSPNLAFAKEASTGRIVYVNRPFETFFRIKAADIIGKTDFDWQPLEIAQHNQQNDREVAESGQSMEVIETVPDANGTPQEWRVLKFPYRDANNQLFVGGIAVNITEQRCLERQLYQQANHDELTQLANRRQFERELTEMLRPREKVGVLCYLDLDQFKLINDSCGHAAGDQLLQQVATILTKQVRTSDTVARLGGDEFAILLRQCSLGFAREITNLMCQRIRALRFVWQGRTFSIGASIGVVAIASENDDAAEIMAAADAACYTAKKTGRNRVHVYNADDLSLSRQRDQQQWCLKIDRALEENRFQLYHQPIVPVGISDRPYLHTEILLRIKDEQGQLIAPMAFIPAAERYHRMSLIDQWVVRHCLAELGRDSANQAGSGAQGNRKQRSKSSHRLYNINLSGASLSDKQCLATLKATIQDSRINPALLCFEITETAAISNLRDVTVFMATLKQIGCQFALDDFGSGMSSFGYLRQLPVDYIKIDGSFIQNIKDPLNVAIVGSICSIGRAMNFQVIAESVEDNTTRRKLKTLGVDYVQGYGIATPAPFSLAHKSAA